MNFERNCGCNQQPEFCCNNIVKKCFVEEVPHVINYNTHVINECVKKHITIPKYTTTEETIYIDQYERPCCGGQMMPMEQVQPIQQNINPMVNPNMFNPFQF